MSWRGLLDFVVAKRRIVEDFNETPPVLKVERLRPLLGKFWHKIPDSNSPGTRSLDGNGHRKRTFVALYGRIGYQMHRARVDCRKTKRARPSARLSRDSLTQRFARNNAVCWVSHNNRYRYHFGKSHFFDIKTEKYLYIYYIHLIIHPIYKITLNIILMVQCM